MKKLQIRQKLGQNLSRIGYFTAFAILLILIPAPNVYFKQIEKTMGIDLGKKIDLPPPPLYPVSINNTSVPQITAEGIYILDLPSNVVIFDKNKDQKFLPASTTKIATALVALDYYQLDDVMTVNTVVNDGKNMGLIKGEQITVESLLYGVLVHSANDAAYVLAEDYPGGLSSFVKKMNEKAAELHLASTHFTNPAGYDDAENYTTPKDLAELAKAALSNKIFSKITSTKSITVSDINFIYFHPLTNVNTLLGKVAGVAGVKTGFTDSAGEILVSEVKKNGENVLFVVLKSNDRFGDSMKLIDWVFSDFEWKPIKDIIPATAVK